MPPAPAPGAPRVTRSAYFPRRRMNHKRTPRNAYARRQPDFHGPQQINYHNFQQTVVRLRVARRAHDALYDRYYQETYDVRHSALHAPWRAWINPPFSEGTRDYLNLARNPKMPAQSAAVADATSAEVSAWLERGREPVYSAEETETLNRWKVVCFAASLKDFEIAHEMRVMQSLAVEESAGWQPQWDWKQGEVDPPEWGWELSKGRNE